MSSSGGIGGKDGFSLLELIVALVIISTILAVSLPQFNLTGGASPARREFNRLTRLLADLKHQAVQEEKTFFLHLSPSGSRLWLTDSSMDESAQETAMETAFETFRIIRISRIETPGTGYGEAETIRFFKRGYSDLAILQVEGLKAPVYLKLEPFLPGTRSLPDLPDINDCT